MNRLSLSLSLSCVDITRTDPQSSDYGIKYNCNIDFNTFFDGQYNIVEMEIPRYINPTTIRNFIKTFYLTYPLFSVNNSAYIYQEFEDFAIAASDLDALEILWEGIYHHDRDNPDYVHCVKIASRYGNIATLKHCIYAYQNYSTLNGVDNIIVKELKKLANNNPNKDILTYLNSLPNVITGT